MVAEFQPYVGPCPFERQHQQIFFGRDHEANELVYRVLAHAAVLLYAQSGAGKTSLINAKITPLLEREGCEVLPLARVQGPLHDGESEKIPNLYVFHTLKSWAKHENDSTRLTQMTLKDFLSERKDIEDEEHEPSPRVAIFDQFEELFTFYPHRWKDRQGLFEQIRDALDQDRLLRILFVMREDFIAELDPYASTLPEKLRTRFRLQRLREKAALLAVTDPLNAEPFKQMGRCFAPGVAEELVQNLLKIPAASPDGEPEIGQVIEPVQLQVVCQDLWRALRSEDKVITYKHLESCGDVNQALSRFYERSIKSVTQEVADVTEGDLRRWFGNTLVTSDGTRGMVFRGREKTGGIPNPAVDLFEKLHLIRGELRGRGRWYELTHDRFIDPIRKSDEKWLAERSGAEQTRQDLERRATEWMQAGRGSNGLLDEGGLLIARRWLESPEATDVGYSEAVFALVQASLAANAQAAHEREQALATERERRAEAERQQADLQAAARQRDLEHARSLAHEQQRRLKQLKVGLIGASILLLSMIAATAFAFYKSGEAIEQRGRAEDAHLKSEQSRKEAQVALDKAKDEQERADKERERAISQAALATKARKEADLQRQIAVSQTRIANERLEQVEFLRRVAHAGQDAKTQSQLQGAVLFAVQAVRRTPHPSLETDQVLRQGLNSLPSLLPEPRRQGSLKHGDTVADVAFSSTGRYFITASADGTIRIAEANTGDELLRMSHEGKVNTLSVSPAGRYIATASSDHTARVWEIVSGKQVGPSMQHDDEVMSVAFSRDGKLLITGGLDSTARVWETGSGKKLASMQHDARVTSVAFSPDGRFVATGSWDKTARVWEATSGSLVAQMPHDGRVLAVGFSPDGRYLACASNDAVRLWIPTVPNARHVVSMHHSSEVTAMAFSRDGRNLASGSRDGTVRIWLVPSGQLAVQPMRHGERISAVVFSPDGRYLATASSDNTARIWDATSGKQLGLMQHAGEVKSLAFQHPDGRYLVTGSADATAKLWKLASGPEVARIQLQETVSALAFSPDGEHLATASTEVRMTDRRITSRGLVQMWETDGTQIGPALPYDGYTRALALRDKSLGATISDKSVRVLDVNSGQEVAQITHKGRVTTANFSPEGRYLVTASLDNTIQIWGANSGHPVCKIDHEGQVGAIALSPDGRTIAMSSEGTVKLWDWVAKREVTRLEQVRQAVALAFSADGYYLATASDGETTVRLWELRTRREVARIDHQASVTSIAFSPRKGLVATGGFDGMARVWLWRPAEMVNELCTRRLTRNMTLDEWVKYMGSEPYAKTCEKLDVHRSVIETGKDAAAKGDARRAISLFKRALELQPDLDVDAALKHNPESYAHSIETTWKRTRLAAEGRRLAAEGNIAEAVKTYRKAESISAGTAISADSWNDLCWYGALWNSAAEVMIACENAVKLAPDKGYILDSRGLALALLGQRNAAIKDFEKFINWTKDEYMKAQRKKWIDELRAGGNPFTTEELRKLRESSVLIGVPDR